MPPYDYIVTETYPHGMGTWTYGYYSLSHAEQSMAEMQAAHPHRTYTLREKNS